MHLRRILRGGTTPTTTSCGPRGWRFRLADVLLAIDPDTRKGLLNARGSYVVQIWNFRKDDLTEQSEECLSFLAQLLN